PGADDGADPDRNEVERTERARERVLPVGERLGAQVVNGFACEKTHGIVSLEQASIGRAPSRRGPRTSRRGRPRPGAAPLSDEPRLGSGAYGENGSAEGGGRGCGTSGNDDSRTSAGEVHGKIERSTGDLAGPARSLSLCLDRGGTREAGPSALRADASLGSAGVPAPVVQHRRGPRNQRLDGVVAGPRHALPGRGAHDAAVCARVRRRVRTGPIQTGEPEYDGEDQSEEAQAEPQGFTFDTGRKHCAGNEIPAVRETTQAYPAGRGCQGWTPETGPVTTHPSGPPARGACPG